MIPDTRREPDRRNAWEGVAAAAQGTAYRIEAQLQMQAARHVDVGMRLEALQPGVTPDELDDG